jgi:tripartite-type tricarboxylate transporter receptor subunit TctC
MTSTDRRSFVRVAAVFAASAVLLTGCPAFAWPERPVRIFTPTAPGGGTDTVARILAEALTKHWNQPVVVESRPGADGFLAVGALLDARDGHALLFTTHSAVTVVPLLHEKLPYDPVRDLVPISLAVDDFLCVAAAPSLPANSLRELVASAQAEPGKLNYVAVPGSPYLAFLAFQKAAGIEMTFVSYRNYMGAIPDLAEGRIQVAVMPLSTVVGQARAGKLKLLAVTNAQRSPAAPDTPTAAEAGFAEFTFGGMLGLFGPKEMGAVTRERIAASVQAVLREAEISGRLTSVGYVARGTTPAEFAAIIDQQRAKWAAIAQAYGARPPQ